MNCPCCGSENVVEEYGPFIEGFNMFIDMKCEYCWSEWAEKYRVFHHPLSGEEKDNTVDIWSFYCNEWLAFNDYELSDWQEGDLGEWSAMIYFPLYGEEVVNFRYMHNTYTDDRTFDYERQDRFTENFEDSISSMIAPDDTIWRNEEWCNYIDALLQDSDISPWENDNWDID
jgi:hypothetical protein